MTRAVQPGAWLGMIGGGVPARLFVLAAQALGYSVAVLDPDARSPAASAADRHLAARCGDDGACAELASLCAGVATESEQVPLRMLGSLGAGCRVSGDAMRRVRRGGAGSRAVARSPARLRNRRRVGGGR
jgi:5-(carboxyamino)imidazole ribonucleotide synthase